MDYTDKYLAVTNFMKLSYGDAEVAAASVKNSIELYEAVFEPSSAVLSRIYFYKELLIELETLTVI